MFITHFLTRTNRVEADSVDQLFISREMRLARVSAVGLMATTLVFDDDKSDSGTNNCKSQKCGCARRGARFCWPVWGLIFF